MFRVSSSFKILALWTVFLGVLLLNLSSCGRAAGSEGLVGPLGTIVRSCSAYRSARGRARS